MGKKNKEREKSNSRISKKKESFFRRFWNFMWNDDSVYSLIFDLILAFILIKYIIYPSIGLAMHTSHPIVAIVSGSMEHFSDKYGMCGITNSYLLSNYKKNNLTSWWHYCGSWYTKRNISFNLFKEFPFNNGLNIGDLVFLKGVKPSQLKVGDVIVYHAANGEPIIHRIVKIKHFGKNIYLQTKGDNNPYSIPGLEFNISIKQVIGKAVYRIPYLGYVKVFASRIVNSFFRRK